MKTMMKYSLAVVVCLFSAGAAISKHQTIKSSEINLNGERTLVYFNDGDTFKILDGSLKQERVRVVGINALETYGPVHEWLGTKPEYLLKIAHKATGVAQTGAWNCVTEKGNDAYGRLLAHCDDLALALIAKGYAHAYSVDNSPADETYLRTQESAQRRKLGMWKQGVPEYIITSLHSADEDAKEPYNRLISATDGRTKKMYHHDSYGTCEKVCLDNDSSCMVYVPYVRRYGKNRPLCLK